MSERLKNGRKAHGAIIRSVKQYHMPIVTDPTEASRNVNAKLLPIF
jgi:hypothetical protein